MANAVQGRRGPALSCLRASLSLNLEAYTYQQP